MRKESLRALAKRYGVNQKTVAKWRWREGVADLPTGPKEPKSTVLTVEEEAIIVAFRRHTLLAGTAACVHCRRRSRISAARRSTGACSAMTHVRHALQRARDRTPPLPEIRHPWTKTRVERTNRTIKEGEADKKMIQWIIFPLNVMRFHYEDNDQLRQHLADFIDPCNFG